MDLTITFLVAMCFLFSLTALFAFVWSLGHEETSILNADANVIFDKGEENVIEEPTLRTDKQKHLFKQAVGDSSADERDSEAIRFRKKADQSSRVPVLLFLISAVIWLLIGSAAGLLSSFKMHLPDLLSTIPELTFGRVRPIHLNAVVYGWGSMAGIGIILWLLPRLLKTELVGRRYATSAGVIWNIAMVIGAYGILTGLTDGMEFLEVHWTTDILFVFAGGLVAVPLFLTLMRRNVQHFYVSGWYFSAALIWFPVLFFVGNIPEVFSGTGQAIVNWWFGHNVLGLWVTPIAVGTAYYLIPKILGVPVYSYRLSLVGFWALALFYSQVGIHHLLGGPVPVWLQTLSIIQSVMMVVPVIAFCVNTHSILKGRYSSMKYSPTLRFVIVGAICYVLSSLQGSMEALRAVNYLVHFTHYTVGHAHLGLYAFFSMILFGAYYFILPRVIDWEWPYPKLISAHFWLVLIGITIYVVALTIGGIVQGIELKDPNVGFMQSMLVTIPYLKIRSFAGALMTLGHIIFVINLVAILLRRGKKSHAATLLGQPA